MKLTTICVLLHLIFICYASQGKRHQKSKGKNPKKFSHHKKFSHKNGTEEYSLNTVGNEKQCTVVSKGVNQFNDKLFPLLNKMNKGDKIEWF